jgi:hypothetical protein
LENLKCLTRAVGDGTWGELQDAYFLATGDANELNAQFSRLAARYGKPVCGGKDKHSDPITDRTLPAGLIQELKHLPRAATIKEKSNL